jgi:Fe-S cluster biosynthesis and repair protein YggX
MMLNCVKCGRTAEPMPTRPMPSALGDEVQKKVCPVCWQEWMGMSTKVINEHRLQLFRPEHQAFWIVQLRLFLNLG